MNVNLTKLISSAAAVLAVGSTSYAQQKAAMPATCCFEQGYEICNDKFPAAYNAAARIDVQCSWDFFVTGSFIYWHVDQDAMDYAYLVNGDSIPVQSTVLVQDFDYKPGFKVGLGVDFDHDNWVGYVEYTWLHQKTNSGYESAPATFNYVTPWLNIDTLGEAEVVSSIGTSWRTNLDIVDAVLSRPFYQGRKLTVLPFGGLRGAWIRQDFTVNAIGDAGTVFASKNRSHSWAVGARAGLQAHWMLGWGFRFEGDAAGSLLYTQYTKIRHNEFADGVSDLSIRYHEYNTVRPMADMSVGMGWGSYLDRQNYHFDLLATYDFNVMWGQNMMRELNNIVNGSGAVSDAGDLHLHGLTVTARFDF